MPAETKTPAAGGFWSRWILAPVMRQLTQGVSPRKVALTLSIGSALALFPIVGTTTVLCTLAALALGLNQPIIQAVNAALVLVYYPLIIVFVRLGDVVARSSGPALDIPSMMALFAHHPGQFLERFGGVALHAALGWLVTAPEGAALVYVTALPLLRSAERRLASRKASAPP